jgi:hypothetical protein
MDVLLTRSQYLGHDGTTLFGGVFLPLRRVWTLAVTHTLWNLLLGVD